METLITGLSYFFWVAVALGILVFVHELGHFLTARMFGMRVDAFSLGMPPNVLKKQIGQTEYRLGALPLGGYVKIAGMVDESLDLDGLESEPRPDEFRAKPVWQRLIVISAGVVFNIVLAFAIYSGLALAYGELSTPVENVPVVVSEGSVAAELGLETGDRLVAVGDRPLVAYEDFLPRLLGGSASTFAVDRGGEQVTLEVPDGLMTKISREARDSDEEDAGRLFGVERNYSSRIGAVLPGTGAADAGVRAGDRIVAVGGTPVRQWHDMRDLIGAAESETVAVRWVRPDSLIEASDPEPVERTAGGAVYEAPVELVMQDGSYKMGVVPDPQQFGSVYRSLGVGESLASGWDQTASMLNTYVGFIGKLFTGRESFRENVGGPLLIAQQSKEMADRGAAAFWSFVALLSIALAVFNILPIPALDGGHIVFLLYEAVARREPSLKVRMVVQQVGLALILALMVFVIFNDALRLFS